MLEKFNGVLVFFFVYLIVVISLCRSTERICIRIISAERTKYFYMIINVSLLLLLLLLLKWLIVNTKIVISVKKNVAIGVY